jgi:rRNA processing protein Gar1
MCDFVEDVRGIPKRDVSISSCDSDPLEFRHRGGMRSSQSSAYGGSDDGGSDDELEIKSCGGDSVASVASSARSGGGGGGGGRDRRFHAMEPLDIQELSADLLARHVATTAADGADAVVDPLPPLEAINIEHVSEAPVAVIESVIVSSSTVVADKRPDALVVDAGTRICLADGTIVGIVATVLGPITSCAYAIACRPGAIADLALEDRIAEGTLLHYDVTKQVVLYDPATQCDSGRGTDASFVLDDELPLGARPDFSDDEDERAWKRRRRENASTSSAADRQQLAADRKTLAMLAAARKAPPSFAAAPAVAVEAAEAVSSSDSEVEFDDEGNMVAYRPRRRKRGL